jgi:hypothetical protein
VGCQCPRPSSLSIAVEAELMPLVIWKAVLCHIDLFESS